VGIAAFEVLAPRICVNDYIDGKMCASKDALALSLFAGNVMWVRLRREVYVHTPKYVGIAPFEVLLPRICVNDYIDGKICASKDALALSLFAKYVVWVRLPLCVYVHYVGASRRLRREYVCAHGSMWAIAPRVCACLSTTC